MFGIYHRMRFFASEAAEPSAVIILAEGQQTVAPHAAIT